MLHDGRLAFRIVGVWLVICTPLAGGASAQEPGAAQPDPRAAASGLYIQPVAPARRAALEFTVAEPSGVARRRSPVRGALPMRRGELGDPKRIRLADDRGRNVPVQGFATAFWPEGTVKFLCVDFLTDLAAGQVRTYRLEYGTAVAPAAGEAVEVAEADGAVTVDTGVLSVRFAPGEQFCGRVKVAGRDILRSKIVGHLAASEGDPKAPARVYPLLIREVKVVERGPVQATVYLRGSYGRLLSATELKWQQQAKVPRYVFHGFVRLYAGLVRMDVIHSFGYNGDEDADFVRSYGLTVPLAAGGKRTFTYGGDGGAARQIALAGDLTLVQPGHSSWRLAGAAEAAGRRFGGWAAVKGEAGSAIVGLRDAWQQWPVRFRANAAGDLTVDIHGGTDEQFLDLRYEGEGFDRKSGKGFHKSASMYPGDRYSHRYGGAPYLRAMGLLKISELVIDFRPGARPAAVGNGHHQMLLPWAGARRFSDTRVLGLTGYYHPGGSKRMRRAKDYFDILLDYPIAAHNANGMYGWVDWPDAPDFRRPVGDSDRFDTRYYGGGVGWSNGERQPAGYLYHFLAGGHRRALDLGHQTVLHTIGFDVEHPGGDNNTGMCHRHSQVHWGTGGGPRQAGWRGWYTHYWLTGHNEILRSLKELHFVPYGVHRLATRAKWPWHHSFHPDTLLLPETTGNVHVEAQHNTPFHVMNLLRWITTGEKRYVRFHDGIMAFWKKNPYVEADGKRTAPAGFAADWRTGRPAASPAGARPAKSDPDDPAAPGYNVYRWSTYGGPELVTDWAMLTGSPEAVDVILAFGDYYASEKRGPRRVDLGCSDGRSRGAGWQLYTAYEAVAPSYALLRGKTHPERAERWRKGMLWRRPCRRSSTPPSAGTPRVSAATARTATRSTPAPPPRASTPSGSSAPRPRRLPTPRRYRPAGEGRGTLRLRRQRWFKSESRNTKLETSSKHQIRMLQTPDRGVLVIAV
ncbi:MAG: exo-rhamnogalacturonan lyase family protein [Planctomycetota bacterium]|jgi:hypothetical protein